MQDKTACAAEAATALAPIRAANGVVAICRVDGTSVRLLPAFADLVIDLLDGVAAGKAVTVVPAGATLTTGQAMNILNVSRPYLAKLPRDGETPIIPVGSHRRVAYADLMAHKDRHDAARNAQLDNLGLPGQVFEAS